MKFNFKENSIIQKIQFEQIKEYIKKLFLEDTLIKIISLILALLIWFTVNSKLVANQESQQAVASQHRETKYFTNVEIRVREQPDNLDIKYFEPEKTTVIYTGLKKDIDKIDFENPVCFINLTDIENLDSIDTPGSYFLDIKLSEDYIPNGDISYEIVHRKSEVYLVPLEMKEVAVSPVNIEIICQEGYDCPIQITPETISIKATSDIINAIEFISTIPYVFPEITEEIEINMDLILPEGVKFAEPNNVDVRVSLEPKQMVKTFSNVHIQILGKRADMEIPEENQITVPLVKVSGPQLLVENMTASDIIATVDVSRVIVSGNPLLPVSISSRVDGVNAYIPDGEISAVNFYVRVQN